jgi:hypothetical protein
MRTLWIVVLCLSACKGHHHAKPAAHDAATAPQSFAEAMQAVCAGNPSDAAYFKAHVANPDVIAMMGALGDAPPAKRFATLRAAVAKANLGSCAVLEKMTAVPVANVPTVTGLGLVELAPNAVAVVATETSVQLTGEPIAALSNGALGTDELAHVERFLTALAANKPGGFLTRVQLFVAPALTARLLDQLAGAIDHAGYKDLALVVNADGVSRAIPFAHRDVAAGRGVRPIVAIGASGIRLYSGDGSEGTADKPKATVASPAELAVALNELVVRRWHGKRTDDDRWLFVTVDPATPIQRVADVLAIARATKDGGELFPQLALTR